jgi:CHAT domain-containing protein/Tfp pilus assembly protein PilF
MACLFVSGSTRCEDPAPDPLEQVRGLIKQGKYSDAEDEARKLLERVESEHGAASAEAAAVIDALVESRWRGGKSREPETRAMAEQVIALKEELLGPDHVDVAESLTNLGVIEFILGDHKSSQASWERALAIRERTLGPEDPGVAQLLNNLANLYTNIGDLAKAREFNARALEIREQVLGPEHALVAQSLNNLAILLTESGDYAQALPLLERSLEIKAKQMGTEHPKYAESQLALARALAETGDYDRALPLFQQAEQTLEQTLGPAHPKVGAALNNHAEILRKGRRYDEARPLYERALKIYEDAYGPDHPTVASYVGNLGYLKEAVGDLAGAIQQHERAVTIRENALEADDPLLALSLNNLASVKSEMREYQTARTLFERALEIRRETLGQGHPLVGESLNGLAMLSAMTGRSDEALEYALDSERIARDHLRLTSRALSEEQALSYATVRVRGLDLALTLAAAGLESSQLRRVFDALVRSRAVVLDEMAARNRTAITAANAEIAGLADELARARARLANLIVRGTGRLTPEAYRALLEEARDNKERAERLLGAASVEFAQEQQRGRLGLAEAEASLPRESALVAIVLYDRWDFTPLKDKEDPKNSRAREAVASYLALVLRPGRASAAVSLGSAKELIALIEGWKVEVAAGVLREGRTAAQAEAAYRKPGEKLRERVWDPLEPHLRDAKRVFVVPDGALNLVSLAALPVGQTGYLVEDGPVLHYLSAERDLVAPAEAVEAGRGLLALGGPDYDTSSAIATRTGAAATQGRADDSAREREHTRSSPPRPSCGGFETIHFSALPSADLESKQIVAIWQAAVPVTADQDVGALHLGGAAATEAALKKEAPGRRVLHLATHGFFLDRSARSSQADSRGIGGLAAAGEGAPARTCENPLSLSGLALAGANKRDAASPEDEDGVLIAEEIASLDLSGVEWAVLSACDTGVGKIQAGEGVFGLRRAMQLAGVRSLIMSLWSVDDEATRQWMEALYRGRLNRNLDTSRAVREASLSVIDQRRMAGQSTHPFYWAAFVPAGDWH